MLIDSHCHLHDREFFSESQAEEMLVRARERGIREIVCIGTSHEDSLVARDFAATHDDVYWTYGVHPEGASLQRVGDFAEYLLSRSNQQLSREKDTSAAPTLSKLMAIGEVGLDYHYEGYNREAQIRLFEEMLQLACSNDLPVSFHVREAFDDFFPVVANFPNVRGVVHSFTDSKKKLKRILNETDFYVGVNGLATYSTLPLPPLERILLETDAPFLTPVPFRGIINEPGYVYEIAHWLANKLAVDFEVIERETTENARKLFNFRDSVLREG